MKLSLPLVAAVAVLLAAGAAAQQPGKPARAAYNKGEIVWGEGPPVLPRGARAAILAGDPGAAGPFTLRVQFPAGYQLPPHTHSSDEHMTVLEGYVLSGAGPVDNDPTLRRLSAGAFSFMPAGTTHYVHAPDGATIQVHAVGPFTVEYADKKDDPRTAPAAK